MRYAGGFFYVPTSLVIANGVGQSVKRLRRRFTPRNDGIVIQCFKIPSEYTNNKSPQNELYPEDWTIKKGPLGDVIKKVLTKDIGVEAVSFCLGSIDNGYYYSKKYNFQLNIYNP